MDWEQLALQILHASFLVILPASLWGHLLYPKEKLAVTFSLGLVLMLATLPLGVALVSAAASLPPSLGLTTILSSVATLAGLTASLIRMRTRAKVSVE